MESRLDSLYPLHEIYEEVLSIEDQNASFEYLIGKILGWKLSTSSIQEEDVLKSVNEASIFQLNHACSYYLLTPLHLAVILGEIALVEALINKGANLLAKDRRQWAPLHHAALRGVDPIWSLLIKAYKDQKIEINALFNDHGGSPWDLQKLLTAEVKDNDEDVFFYEKEGKLLRGNALLFKELFAADFIKDISFRPQQLVEEWLNKDEVYLDADEIACSQFVAPFYEESLNRALPPVYTAKAFTTIEGKYIDIGFNAHAVEEIPSSTMVVEYLGERLSDLQEKSVYRWGKIDAKNKRNLAAILADGFPNAVAFYIYHQRGVAVRTVFVSLDKIHKGESLCFNYGKRHSVKLGYHEEFRVKEMEEFFRQTSFTGLVRRIEMSRKEPKHLLGWQKTLQLESDVTKLQYIFHTPSAMCHLLFNKLISPSEVYGFFANSQQRQCLLSFSNKPNVYEHQVLCCHENISLLFDVLNALKGGLKEGKHTDFENALFSWLLQKSSSLTVKAFCLKLLELICEEVGHFISQFPSSEALFLQWWEERKEDLYRKALNWEDGPSGSDSPQKPSGASAA